MKEPYIAYCTDFIIIKNVSQKYRKYMKEEGFCVCGFKTYKKAIKTKKDIIYLFDKYNKLGFLFLFNYGWYPSEVFEKLREDGELKGKYKQLILKNKKKYIILDK